MYFTTSAPNFLWGGCFQFFTKNRPQKHQKRAILHTLQPNGGARAPPPPAPPPPPPPPLATLLKIALGYKNEITSSSSLYNLCCNSSSAIDASIANEKKEVKWN